MTILPFVASVVFGLLARADDATLAFIDVNVVPMDRPGVLAHQTVLVRGDRIVAVGAVADVEVPRDARVVEGRGGYLVPGLIDTHVHTFDRRDLDLFLAHGVTTIRHLNGNGEHLRWRAAIANGELSGPRMFVSGPHRSGIHDVATARAEVDSDADAGFDFVKVYDDVTADAYAAMVAEARKRAIRIGGHIPRNLELDTILDVKPDSIEHAEEFLYARFAPALDEATIAPVARSIVDAKISIAATLVAYDAIGRQCADLDAMLDRGDNAFVGAWKRRSWGFDRNRYRKTFNDAGIAELRRRLVFQRKFVRAFHEAGGRVLLGTDAGGPPFVVPGASALDELEQLVSCGLTPFAALRAATRDAAEYLGAADTGVLAPDMRADFVLVFGNPLDDITNMRLQIGVVAAGRWHEQSALREKLDDLRDARRAEERIVAAIDDGDTAAADAALSAWIADEGAPPFDALAFNEFGYTAWRIDRDAETAGVIFALNTRAYPQTAFTWESLGDWCAANSDEAHAAEAYRRVLELEPDNAAVKEALARIADSK